MSNVSVAPASKPIFRIPVPEESAPDVVIAEAMKDDHYWMQLSENVWARPLMFNVGQGSWVNLIKARGDGVVSRHRHPAPVTGFTLEGAWHYPEHDWIATPGTFIFEPAGDTHTLTVHPSAGHMMCLFHNFGPVLYVDENGKQVEYDDVFTRLERFKAHCRKLGLPPEEWKKMIR